jgi:hypothetical protein
MKKIGLTLVLALSLAFTGLTARAFSANRISSAPTAVPTPAEHKPRSWKVIDRYDPTLPELIVPSKAGLRLDPNWKVANIDLVYQLWGYKTPTLIYQNIAAEKGKYKRGEEKVDPKLVKKFFAAIDRLRPSQLLLEGPSGLDNFLSVEVELTGEDGQRILLQSLRDGNPGNSPWNVYYNGRLYAQYDGSLADPLAELFPNLESETGYDIFASGTVGDKLIFQTSGLPPQLIYGFNGLLPVSNGLEYQVDVEKGVIQGQLEGNHSQRASGNQLVGGISGLQSIFLLKKDGKKVACQIEKLGRPDAPRKAWEFTCPVPEAQAGKPYKLPIQFTVTTKQGETLATEGELYGAWEAPADFVSTPEADEIAQALHQSPEAVKLLEEHVASWTSYQAETSADSPKLGNFAGQVTLLGETSVNQKPLRYAAKTPLVIQKGKLTRFDLTQAALDDLIKTTLENPLTQRVLKANSGVLLNLWYAKPGPWPEIPYLVDAVTQDTLLSMGECGPMQAMSLPNEEQPLLAFGFNQLDNPYFEPQFLHLDEKTIAGYVDLTPDSPKAVSEGIQTLLVPRQLDTGNQRPFQRIILNNAAMWNDTKNLLQLKIPEDATPAELENYHQIADKLPGYVDRFDPDWWTASGIGFVVAEDGRIDLVSCAAPAPATTPTSEVEQAPVFTTFKELKPALDVSSSPKYPNEQIWAVAKDKAGFWKIASNGFVEYPASKWMGNAELTQVAINPYNLVWIGSVGQGVFSFDGRKWVQFYGKNGPPGKRVNDLFIDDRGLLWAATDNGAAQYDGTKWITFAPDQGWTNPSITAIAEYWDYPKKTMWFASDGGGIAAKIVKDWIIYTKASTNGGLVDDRVSALATMANGDLWAGTFTAGLSRFDGETWNTFTTADGLPSNTILSLGIINSGNRAVWAGTDRGLARFDGRNWKVYTMKDGLPSNRILSINVAENVLWLATDAGVVRLVLPVR